MRKDFLKEHRRGTWLVLLNTGKLADHLREIENAANARLDELLPVLSRNAGVTEELKATDPIRWVGLMNTCKAQAKEIIFAGLIYI